ncbi:AAA family ATPase [Pseudomonas wadenswilerensis]|uniref:Metal-dependent phosphohydrolase n=1 Tax=Pseudomonas wadenswilerensis TaxID=1785161 RepID=A0A380SZV5_9PSED|nr:AAA family ATPase [Pseudomonas wadenswilerensis]UVM19953.1 AAA family ATPase [Pseudomonas wadenswilerensis]SUQ63572.1 Metal-dependent phosphohydrolase [Pseudomonas wadenswilerensis]
MDMNTLQGLMPSPGRAVDYPALLEAIPSLRALAATPQDPVFHQEGDVWTHTMMVVDALLADPVYQRANPEQQFVLFYAAVLHDIAKPSCTVIDEITGKIGQPGHSRRGAVDARILLWQAGVPFELRETICRIINVHQLPFFALAGDKSGRSAEQILHRLSWEVPVWMLCAVASADMQGRGFAGKQGVLDDIEVFRLLAEDEGCLDQPKAFADDYTRRSYFRGASVLPQYSLYREVRGSQVIVLAGLPASGKDTWVNEHAPKLAVVSFDDARQELGLSHGDKGPVAQYAIDKAKALLRRREPFVWNSTHLSQQMRKKTLDLLYSYDADVQLVYLEQSERELMRRNARRDTTLRNKDIERMYFRWEVPTPVEADRVEYQV